MYSKCLTERRIRQGTGGAAAGNGVVGILAETCNIWERRAPLAPSHCARLLLDRCGGVKRIVVQPSTKRIHRDAKYAEVGCELSDDLSSCGLILGIKQPKLETILPDRAYAFFSHTTRRRLRTCPSVYFNVQILAERVTLYDYELIVGDNGKRVLAFGKFAGRAGLIDFLHGLGKRYLNLGYSTPFLSLGSSHMYPSLAAAKAAVISVVSQGAQEIFKLLPHKFVDPRKLPELADMARDQAQRGRLSKSVFQVYGCTVTCQHMVAPKDPQKRFDKDEYYAHPKRYEPIFHKTIAPYASVIGFLNCSPTSSCMNCKQKVPLVGISDITCDIGGSMEFVNQTTSIEKPFFRYNAITNSYHEDMAGEGVICLAVDILPTEFPRERLIRFAPSLRRACISYEGKLTQLYEYIPRMRTPVVALPKHSNGIPERKNYTTMVSLSGHLFDQFLINEALDIIEAASGSFRLINCEVGQSTNHVSYSELEVGASDARTLDQIVDSLSSIASRKSLIFNKEKNFEGKILVKESESPNSGAGRVCQPAAKFLASVGRMFSGHVFRTWQQVDEEELEDVQVIVASLYLKDAEEIIDGIPNAIAVQLDVMDEKNLSRFVSDVDVVISLLPANFHLAIANKCIEHKKHLVTASYVDDSMSRLDAKAKSVGITILCEMGLDPGIGKVTKFTSYCGGLPSPEAADNPLAYKFSWNPAGAIRAGRNSATYKCLGETIQVNGDELYDSAVRFRVPDLPAFALEHLPNRNSLAYGDLYGIGDEASTVFRATLRYEGFSEIMGTLAKIGFFNSEAHPMLKESSRPTFRAFLSELLKADSNEELPVRDEEMAGRIISLGHCKETVTAMKAVQTIKFLGLHEDEEIPLPCQSAFDISCWRMEGRLAYSSTEKDMVLLHHEVELELPDGQRTESHRATLLEFGRTKDGKMTSAMAITVGIPMAIGALLLLKNRVKTTGILRPLVPEVYIPALEILEACGVKLMEKVDILC
ncbi:unnamed protein product [Spirodela intermedia]|uniref:Alanine dehydrogenase/pyridine nucleotide transhydrogenase N-terminal domain-containing protein n=1 Tax=Spirodela intermedia TaxID=51605 RepID=A0A7I8IMF4_SPIIN|nr:unnamed protein product [Spirodela intermedia]CAA6658720.1 unnamed protein product [Spirodela intermedia]